MYHHPLEQTCNSTRLSVLQIPRLLFLGLQAPSHGTHPAVLREHVWDADKKKAKCDGRQPCHQCVLFDAVCEYAEGKEDRIKR